VQFFILISSSPLKFEEAERRAVLSIFSGPGCVWQTLAARSLLSARSVGLWARCLAHCEGTKPSIYSSVSNRLVKKINARVDNCTIVKFIFVIEIGKLLKVDFVPKNSANTTETYDSLVLPNHQAQLSMN
jgi:hypothetical protein